MKQFSTLFQAIESTTSSNAKISAIVNYFEQAQDLDKLWCIAIFSHKRPKRSVTTTLLRTWAAELADIPQWLFEETYHIVGDLAETISKVTPANKNKESKTLSDWIQYIIDLKELAEEEKKEKILYAWSALNSDERFLFNKLITGGFRMGVAQKTIVKALSRLLGQEENVIAHKLMGNWTPQNISYQELLLTEDQKHNLSKPYPFYLAYALDSDLQNLGAPDDWFAEYKWDGIRGQIIKRDSHIYVWSRGEELVTHQYPEFDALIDIPDDFVIDGEVLVIKEEKIASFNALQKRIGRKAVSKKMRTEYPVKMMVYDLLELNNADIRDQQQQKRRLLLEKLFLGISSEMPLRLSPLVSFSTWEELHDIRNNIRKKDAEGLMLKRKTGPYKTGRKKGDWYKWKVDPMTIDAVMIYAQRGHGRRANLFTDFTFALKDGDRLVPFAKAYSGLTDIEFREVSQFVRKNTLEKFGPVSSVRPELVFEVAFEGIAESKRHKSGIALRFPRIKRWRKDKPVSEINTLDDIKKFLSSD